MKILRAFGNSNPSGVTIYPGYYALVGCILLNMTVEEAIAKIIYGVDVSAELKPHKGPSKRSEICKAYKQGIKDYAELARRFNCSRAYVWEALTKKGLVEKAFYYERFNDLIEKEPQLSTKEVAERIGCGMSTANRLLNRYYREHRVGYFA